MIMRRRPLLRAAVVGGGAYMAGKSAARRQQEQADSTRDQRVQDVEQQPAQVPSQGSPSLFDQLNQLSIMHDKGSLTDEEFAAAKSRLLGGA